nr:ATP phosphoribosyltransferase regulatory subunit [Hyphomonas sp. Mor2]
MSVSEKVSAAIAARGGEAVDVPIIIEASVPLELSGEVVRSRICTFADAEGREWALRPDLTLPVALAEIAARRQGRTAEAVRRYRGPVFRLPSVAGEPVEYEQVGLERFAAPRGVSQDVWVFEAIAEACTAAGVGSGETSFGDLSIFPRFVDALGLPEDVAAGLKRAFRQEGGVRAYLAGQGGSANSMSNRLKGMGREDVASFVDDIYAMTGLKPVGVRTGEEVVERLYQSAQAATGSTLSPETDAVLTQLLALEVPFQDAPAALADLARDAGLEGLNETLETFAERTERLAQSEFKSLLGGAQFATRFGRRFTYYDGFVFEIASAASEAARLRPLAAGGRYDSLLSDLSSGEISATAIGGIVIPHRVASLSGECS